MKIDTWTSSFTSSLAANIIGGLIVALLIAYVAKISDSGVEPTELSKPATPTIEFVEVID